MNVTLRAFQVLTVFIFAIAGQTAFSSTALSDSSLSIRIPLSIAGDWHYTNLACGSPKSIASGVHISSNGNIVQRDGGSECRLTEWEEIPVSGGKELVSNWRFSALCAAPVFKDGKGHATGTIQLKEMGQPSELILFIDWRYDQSTLANSQGHTSIYIAQRCTSPRRATNYGWAKQPKN